MVDSDGRSVLVRVFVVDPKDIVKVGGIVDSDGLLSLDGFRVNYLESLFDYNQKIGPF